MSRLPIQCSRAKAPDFKTWCRQEGLEHSLSTQMAYVILNPPKNPHIDALLPSLPLPLDWGKVWGELVQWRYPQLGLNLLQLAIIFGQKSAAITLWQPPFLQEESYTDESSRLVNHPVHLLLTFGRDIFDDISRRCHIGSEIFCKKGTVDLTSATLRMPHSKTRLVEVNMDSPSAQAAPTGVCVSQGRAAQENPLRELMERYGSSGTSNSFEGLDKRIDFVHLRQLESDTIETVTSHLKVELWERTRTSAVELLWAVVEVLSSRGIRSPFYKSAFLPSGHEMWGELREELLILACQLYWAVSRNDSEFLALDDEVADTMATFVKRRLDILRAVRYLPNETILHIIDHFQCCAGRAVMLQRSSYSELYSAAAEDLTRMLQKRTLQDHSVLSILKAVRGDARKVWSMTDYPEVLRQIFHVPLKELHQSLQSASQVD